MEDILKTLKQYKTDREVDEYNEDGQFRIGYVKAMNDAINLINKNSISTVLSAGICDQCKHPEMKNSGDGMDEPLDPILYCPKIQMQIEPSEPEYRLNSCVYFACR